MKTRTALVIGIVAIVPAAIIGVATASWALFTLVCIATGLVLGVGASILVLGQAPPRDPDENLRQMKANQYGYVAGLESPTQARAFRPVLIGVPAFVVGIVVLILSAARP
jgi:uncharacterized membrane protein YccC